MLWTIALTLISVLGCTVARDKYLYHYVEDKCKMGNETITYMLDPSSPEKTAVILKAVKYHPYSPNRDCMIVLTAPPAYGIVLSVRKIDFIEGFYACSDYLEVILPSFQSSKKFCKFIFDLKETRSFYTDGPIKLLYHSEARKFGLYFEIGFELTVTAVSDGNSQCAEPYHFRCANNRCISKGLLCDGHNNCGDNTDENLHTCDPLPSLPNNIEGYVVYICVAVLFVLIIVTTFSYLVYKQKLRLGNTIATDDSMSGNSRSRYEAMHPASNFCNQNPDGSRSYTNFSRPVLADHDGGISNPYYSLGPPPPPYNP